MHNTRLDALSSLPTPATVAQTGDDCLHTPAPRKYVSAQMDPRITDEMVDLHEKITAHQAARSAMLLLKDHYSERWFKDALGGIAVSCGHLQSSLAQLRAAAGLEPNFSLDEIARPIAPGSGIRSGTE